MSILFDRTKKLAEQKKITLSQLENDIGISKTSIYTWKNVSPKSETLQKVAEILDTSTDYLLGRTNDPTPPNTEIEDEDIAMAFRIDMKNVPEEKREAFKDELRTLRKYMIAQLKEMEKEDKKNKD